MSKFIPPNADQIREFIFSLISLVETELAAESSSSSQLFATSTAKDLERKGLSIGGLKVGKSSIGIGGKRLIELEKSFAIHSKDSQGWGEIGGFRSGDVVEIVPHSGTAKETIKIEGVVHKMLPEKIIIAIKSNGASKLTGEKGEVVMKTVDEEEVELPELIRISKLSNPSTSLKQISALRDLLTLVLPKNYIPSTILPPPIDDAVQFPVTSSFTFSTNLSPLVSVLLGLTSPSKPSPSPSEPIKFFNQSLNDSQKEAIRFILEDCAEVAEIWGPPGTGKTASLVELVLQILSTEPNSRILICGASNLSVDNLVERLSFIEPKVPLTRIGHPSRVLESLASKTLDAQLTEASDGIILGIKAEIEHHYKELGKGKLRGKQRREIYDQIKELKKNFRMRESKVLSQVLGGSRVTLSTLHGATNWVLNKEPEYDWLIIDEAAQATEASCWSAILRAKRLVLAGDHLQLPPTIISAGSHRSKRLETNGKMNGQEKKKKGKGKSQDLEEDIAKLVLSESAIEGAEATIEGGSSEIVETSSVETSATPSQPSSLLPTKNQEFTLFSRLLSLHGTRIQKMLSIQYRFNSIIGAFPSSAMYEDKLLPHPSIAGISLQDLDGADEDNDDEALSSVVFYDTAGLGMLERSNDDDGGSKCNENEVDIVVKHVELLIAAGIKPEDIAIISPYNAQVALISGELKIKHPKIQIGSIDSFQGREADVIIISLVRSNDQREVGFLKESRRLNVAMTRAKRQLCIVGDSDTLKSGSVYLRKWMHFLEEEAVVIGLDY